MKVKEKKITEEKHRIRENHTLRYRKQILG